MTPRSGPRASRAVAAACRSSASFALALLIASAHRQLGRRPRAALRPASHPARRRASSAPHLRPAEHAARRMRWSRALALVFVVAMSATMHALAVETGGQASPQYERMNLVILGLAVFATWSATWAALACGLVIGVYLLGTAARPTASRRTTTWCRISPACSRPAPSPSVPPAVRERQRWRSFRDRRALTRGRRQTPRERAALSIARRDRGQRHHRAGTGPPHSRVQPRGRGSCTAGLATRCWAENYATLFLPEARRRAFALLLERVLAGESIHAIESPVRSRSGRAARASCGT